MTKSAREARQSRRLARRDARRLRFSGALTTPGRRLSAWLDMVFVDHGFFRYVYLNRHKLSDRAYRSAQPAPHHIRAAAKDGVRTIISLRGGRELGSYPLEVEACRRHGLAFEELTLRSRAAPTVDAIEGAAALFERVEYPVLFHCKSGADRAGLMSALYMLLVEGADAETAGRQLSLRYGHIKQGKTGVLDAFIAAFAAAERAAAARGEQLDFLTWVRTDYDPAALMASFQSARWGSFLVDKVLRRE